VTPRRLDRLSDYTAVLEVCMRRLLIVSFSLVALGCASATGPFDPPDGSADFQTDSSSYTLAVNSVGYVTTIGYTYTNTTSQTANFVNCLGGTDTELQKLTNDQWTTVWSPVMLACLSPPIIVAPGQQYRGRINVFSGFPGANFFPVFSTPDISGTYRVLWTQLVSDYQSNGQSFGAPLSIDHRVSNQFTIVAPARPPN
jgi:hypothetical protein